MKTRLKKCWAVYSFEDGHVIAAFTAESRAHLYTRRANKRGGHLSAVCFVRYQLLKYADLPIDEMPPCDS
jgi:hypothetical protein